MFFSEHLKKIIIGGVILLAFLIYLTTIASPHNYPKHAIISVREGAGLIEVSKDFESKKIIRSPFWFRTAAILIGGERSIKAGDYYLPRRENAFKLAWRVVKGKREIETVKITIPEGFTKREIANLFTDKFPRFDKDIFLNATREGYLFPDTYFVEVSATASSTATLLSNNFLLKLKPYEAEVASSTHSLDEIIIMASILEEEANTDKDREIVSGILWKRLKMNMPLQVDATLRYLTGRGSNELTQSDLESESAYNSYNHTGLPPTAISNPGTEAIEAALRPIASPYLYFLTDSEGNMHYAKTFEEHKKNKEKYIRN